MAFSYSRLDHPKNQIRSFLHSLHVRGNTKIIYSTVIIGLICLFTISHSSYSKHLQDKYPNVLDHVSPEQSHSIIKDQTLNHQILDYDRDNIKYIYPEVVEQIYNNTDLDGVDWSKYAYVLYATSSAHMCNAMMIFAELRKFKTKAQLVMLVNADFLEEPTKYEYEFTTLTSFSEKFHVKLKPTKIKRINDKHDVNIWISSFTKLMVFNETDYDRVIYLDSDAILINDNIDELFFIPPCKMASVTGYWLTKDRYAKDEIKNKYSPNDYDFKPLTKDERSGKINNLIDQTIKPFTNIDGHLPINNNVNTSTDFKINEKNFYNNLYNNLPNFKFLDEYSFTNIIMVIQPSQELFARIEESFNHRQKNEFDMDIINFYVFKMSKCLNLQDERKPKSQELNIEQLINDIPEYLILPHQVYGTLTSEFNLVKDHASFLADPQDQPFVYQDHGAQTTNNQPAYYDLSKEPHQAKQFYPNVKYLHFSDSPIPKPWFEKNLNDDYMSRRLRCESHPDFHQKEGEPQRVKPMGTIEDCSAGDIWENIHELFGKIRFDVCKLRLKQTTKNPYTDDIN